MLSFKMLTKLAIHLLLVNFLSLIDVEGKVLEKLWFREEFPEVATTGGQHCEAMTFSLPKPETGCCGLHKFDESTFRAARRSIFKRNIQEDETSDDASGVEDAVLNGDDEGHPEYVYDKFELENDAFRELRKKREVIDGFKDPLVNFVIGGRKSDISHYPWMVHLEIYFGGRPITSCGGSLINSKFVLTAGHCVRIEFESLNDIRVVLAEFDTRSFPIDCVTHNDRQQQCIENIVMNPEQIILHPQGYDIAMLRLRGEAPYSEFIRPICLPPFNIDTPRNRDLELLVAGWGSTYQGSPGYPTKLSATVNLVPIEECRLLSPVPSNVVCAIGHYGQDACHGDSGGPLMFYHNGNYFLAGIVSGKHVPARCGSSVPTSYMNVYMFTNWIQSVMTPYSY